MKKSTAIGIDLGTTYCCVAALKGDTVLIFNNEEGSRTTPSFVAFEEGSRLVGQSAKDLLQLNSCNTFYDIKRIIGRNFQDEHVQADMKNWPFKVVDDKGMAALQPVIDGKPELKKPEELSAALLLKMKLTAETALEETVLNAVVTVPAYFNDWQREATKSACKIAGLNVLRIINEPTAAALAYAFHQKKLGSIPPKEGQTCLVYDFGGGTFDVTVLELTGSVYQVKATGGDSHLGGQDVDKNIYNAVVEEWQKNFDIKSALSDPSNSSLAADLLQSCEKAKRGLSAEKCVKSLITLRVSDKQVLKFELSRFLLELENLNIFLKTMEIVKETLHEANLNMNQIDQVFLVGGSTRIPWIRDKLGEMFSSTKICSSICEDEAVAYGAAVQASNLMGYDSNVLPNMTLVDVTPLSLGVEVKHGNMSFVVKRNTPIPHRNMQVYSTDKDNQTTVRITVYQGESKKVKENLLLGTIVLTDLPRALRRTLRIEVEFRIDEDGILNVTARHEESGVFKEILVTKEQRTVSEDKIAELIREAEMTKQKEDEEKTCKFLQYKLQKLSSNLLRMTTSVSNAGKISDSLKKEMVAEANKYDQLLQNQSVVESKTLETYLSQLNDYVTSIKEKYFVDTSVDENIKFREEDQFANNVEDIISSGEDSDRTVSGESDLEDDVSTAPRGRKRNAMMMDLD